MNYCIGDRRKSIIFVLGPAVYVFVVLPGMPYALCSMRYAFFRELKMPKWRNW
jgi:hypothetical protein